MPNTTSTPTFSMARTRACAPVTRAGAAAAWAAGGCAAGGWAAGDAAAGGAGAAGRGVPLGGCCAAALAGMSSGDGACGFGGTGLVCSVIGCLLGSQCHDGRGWELKTPWCRAAVEGRAQKVARLALCPPAKYEDDVDPLHDYTLTHKPAPRQIIARLVSLSETTCPEIPSSRPLPVLISASTPGAAIGLATRNPCP